VLRLSGPRAVALMGCLADVPLQPARTAHLRTLRAPGGEVLDQAVVTLFPAPDSYTGEDVVEISTHGGRVAPRLVLDTLVRLGARPARAGEFTQRAWLNGKLDLVQAEAVADLVESSNRALHRVALDQLDRGLSTRLAALRTALVELEARLVHHIDFPEEDDAPTGLDELSRRATELAGRFDRLAATAPLGRVLRHGVRTVIAGRPNAGKSSLLNALVGERRAIVTEVAGTTRDRIEVEVEVEGLPLLLVDTAGLRATTDPLEREGVEIAEAAVGAADLILHCVPVGSEASEAADRASLLRLARSTPVIGVRTKVDLASASPDVSSTPHPVDSDDSPKVGEGAPDQPLPSPVEVSAHTGEGLDRLRRALVETVLSGHPAGRVGHSDAGAVLTRDRQVECVTLAAREVRAFARAIEGGIPPEVASAHLKSAATATEELLGTIGTEDVLDRVFSDFCIGK